MKALILAAGLGTRLSPLTDNKPKALVPFRGMPMVERIIRNLAAAEIDHVIVNVHHFAAQLTEYLNGLVIPGVTISVSDEKDRLMDTGGALLHARDYFAGEDAFLVHNVDVMTSLDIPALIRSHRSGSALATLAVKKRITSRSLLFDGEGCLAGWRHNETGEERIIRKDASLLEDYGNSCVQVINMEFMDHFPDTEPLNLTEMYLDLAADNRIHAFIHNEDYWYDLGRYQNFMNAEKELDFIG